MIVIMLQRSLSSRATPLNMGPRAGSKMGIVLLLLLLLLLLVLFIIIIVSGSSGSSSSSSSSSSGPGQGRAGRLGLEGVGLDH